MKTCLFHNAAYMEHRNYISKYCEKNSAPKKISYTMHDFPVYYVSDHFLHKNYFFHFPKKNNFMLVTPRTERYEGVLHI